MTTRVRGPETVWTGPGLFKGQKALHWKLLSTEEASDFAQASEQLQWYAKRWNIEVFHRTLKSGCQVERRQLCTYEGLERMLMYLTGMKNIRDVVPFARTPGSADF